MHEMFIRMRSAARGSVCICAQPLLLLVGAQHVQKQPNARPRQHALGTLKPWVLRIQVPSNYANAPAHNMCAALRSHKLAQRNSTLSNTVSLGVERPGALMRKSILRSNSCSCDTPAAAELALPHSNSFRLLPLLLVQVLCCVRPSSCLRTGDQSTVRSILNLSDSAVKCASTPRVQSTARSKSTETIPAAPVVRATSQLRCKIDTCRSP